MATLVVTPTPSFGRVTIVSENASAGVEVGQANVSITSDLISAVISSTSSNVTIGGGTSVVITSAVDLPQIGILYGLSGPPGPPGPAGPAGGESVPYSIRVDEVNGGITYIGEADPGVSSAAASWRIKRLTETGPDIVIAWADGNANFDNVWNDRLGLTYS